MLILCGGLIVGLVAGSALTLLAMAQRIPN